MATDILKILMLEDVSEEAELIQRKLRHNTPPCAFKVVMTRNDFIRELNEFKPDVILSDNEMPQFSGLEALEILKHHSPDLPFILVTGTVSEEFAVGIMKAGADDYLLKDRLSRLPVAIETVLKIKQAEKEKKESDLKLAQSEKRFRGLVENNEGIISTVDENLVTIYRSASATRITGWTNEEYAKIDTAQYIHPDDLESTRKTTAIAMNNPGLPVPVLLRVRHKESHYIWLEGVITNMLHDNAIKGIVSNLRDVTERINTEQKIIKTNRLYAFISQINQLIVRTTNEQILFSEVCNIAVNYGKFKMAWIGMVDEATQKVIAVVHAGEDSGYLSSIKKIETNNVNAGNGPTGTAIREGEINICNDIENDERMAPWKDAAISRGYHSSIAIPIRTFGKVVGAFSLYACEKNFFDNEEIRLLEEATGDVSFALEFFEKEQLRKKAESKVLESEQSYHTLTEISPVGIFRTDAAGLTTYVNPRWCEISGIPAEAALGNGWLTAIHEEDKKIMLEGWKKALSAKDLSISEYRFVRPDGTITWVYGQATPETNLNNKIVGYVGTITDITERKKAEEEIKTANERFDMISRATNDAVFEYDLITGESWHNDSFIALFNTPDSVEVVKPDTEKWKAKIHPDDRERVIDKLHDAHTGQFASWGDEFRFQKADGSYGVFYDRAKIIRDENGKAVSLVGSMVEITDLKNAEEKLLQQKVQLETLSNNLPGVMIYQLLLDLDGTLKFTYISSGVTELTGKTQEEVIENPAILYELIYKEDLIKLIEGEKESLKNMSVFRMEARCVTYKSEIRWLKIVSTPRKLNDGRIVWDGFHMDITERRKAEEAIRESEEKYRVLVEEASEGIFISDATGRFITVNASACRISQYSEQELLQMSIFDFFIDDDILARPLQFEALKQGKTVVSERIMKRKDGQNNYLEITSKLLTDGRLLSLVRDVEERKKAEEAILLSNERYNLVSKATNDSIWDLDIITDIITRTGDGFKTLFGYDDTTQINSNKKFTSLIHPEDIAATHESLKNVFDNPNIFYWEQEYRLLKADGNYAFVYDKGYIIRDESGNALRMIGATQDVTKLRENEIHLKKLNENLLEQANKLTESNDELERFAYVASHDMQEPLRMVTSFLVLLEKKYQDTLDESAKKYIHFAVDGAKRMRQIILDLLDFSRVGQDYIEPQQLDLNALISEIELLFSKQIEEKNATIEADNLPVITASESPVRQVFQNLISNALKYSLDSKPVRIKIAAISQGNYWQFSVEDNGIGISDEYFDKIFVIFQRLHNHDQFSGTGIGLAITKKIINKLGGKIWVESSEGKGTTFYFTIKK